MEKENRRQQETRDALARQKHKESSDRLKKIEQQKQQRQVKKPKKKPLATPWAGTFRGTTSLDDGDYIVYTLRLTQNGNQLGGDGSRLVRMFGKNLTLSLSLQGLSNGRSATIQASDGYDSITLSIQLSSSGDHMSTDIGGEAVTLRRL